MEETRYKNEERSCQRLDLKFGTGKVKAILIIDTKTNGLEEVVCDANRDGKCSIFNNTAHHFNNTDGGNECYIKKLWKAQPQEQYLAAQRSNNKL